MKVLFQARKNLFTVVGGDTIQVLSTKRELEKLGVSVDILLGQSVPNPTYDLIHLFNITDIEDTYLQMKNAKKQGSVVALSTIYWSFDEYRTYADTYLRLRNRPYRKQVHSLIKLYSQLSFRFSRVRWSIKAKQREVLKLADILLPNSESEMALIAQEFGIKKPYAVIPNCCDIEEPSGKTNEFIETFALPEFVLCVGNVTFRKNQLSLIKALRDTNIPLVIAGQFHERWYEIECRQAAGPNTIFIGPVDRSELPALYRAAKVHVLPSWFETPGLASLEAALFGCNIVSTNRGSAEEYFGNLAWYCDPADQDSIKKSVLQAYTAEKSNALIERVSRHYTWSEAAKATLSAYERALGASQ